MHCCGSRKSSVRIFLYSLRLRFILHQLELLGCACFSFGLLIRYITSDFITAGLKTPKTLCTLMVVHIKNGKCLTYNGRVTPVKVMKFHVGGNLIPVSS